MKRTQSKSHQIGTSGAQTGIFWEGESFLE